MKTCHKPLAFFLSVLLLAFCQTLQAQTAEDARIARLAGLARVWGTVKYFHPFLGYRDIDWDKALIEAIPKVNAAKSPQDYQAALNQMLAVLNDKSTHADFDTPTTPSGPSATTIRVVWRASIQSRSANPSSPELRTFRRPVSVNPHHHPFGRTLRPRAVSNSLTAGTSIAITANP